MNMNRKINTYRSLLHLVKLDETDHILKDIAQLFLSALTDQPTETHHDIVKCIGYAYFNILTSSEDKAVDYVHWLGLETDKIKSIDGIISTSMLLNTGSNNLIQRIVKRLAPLKDQLIDLKQEHPDLHFELTVLFWSHPVGLYIDLDNETLRFFAETGITFRSELFVIQALGSKKILVKLGFLQIVYQIYF